MSIGAVNPIGSGANALLSGLLGPGVVRRAAFPAGQSKGAAGEVQGVERTRTQGLEATRTGDSSVRRPNSTAGQPAGLRSPDGDSVHLSAPSQQLTEEEQQEVEKLRSRDAEVRAHEQAHVAAAGSLARGGANYEYKTGPDGKRYAVGGHVNVDTSPVPSDPEATIAKASQIRAAALAPANPSSADRAAAAKASQMEAEARRELRSREQESQDGTEAPKHEQASMATYGPKGRPGGDSAARFVSLSEIDGLSLIDGPGASTRSLFDVYG